jgi:hypothetical protein
MRGRSEKCKEYFNRNSLKRDTIVRRRDLDARLVLVWNVREYGANCFMNSWVSRYFPVASSC